MTRARKRRPIAVAHDRPTPRRDAFDVAQDALVEADTWLRGTATVMRPAREVVEDLVEALRDALAAHDEGS